MEFKKTKKLNDRHSRPPAVRLDRPNPAAQHPDRTAYSHAAPSPQTTNALSSIQQFVSSKSVLVVGIIIMTSIVFLAASTFIGRQNTDTQNVAKTTTKSEKIAKELENQVVLPKNKPINTIDGHLLQPPKSDPIFVFTDNIGGNTINVTQQTVPDSFKGNIDDGVATMAKKFNATSELKAGNTVLYIGSSSKGPQSVIFAKNDLIILIKSQKKIENKDWINYIQTLS